MKYALTSNGYLIHISKAWKGCDFYCPYCGDNLIIRKGKINKWHFAHKKNQTCTQTHYEHKNKFAKYTQSDSHTSTEQTSLKIGYREVKDLFVQQDEPIYDCFGVRWIKCEICGEIKPKDCFVDYGGKNRFNSGICKDCASQS